MMEYDFDGVNKWKAASYGDYCKMGEIEKNIYRRRNPKRYKDYDARAEQAAKTTEAAYQRSKYPGRDFVERRIAEAKRTAEQQCDILKQFM